MPTEIGLLVCVSLVTAFVVIQLGNTRLRGVIPLVAGIGAAVFSYRRYSNLAGFLGRLEGTFDSQITYLQYFWLGSILLWIVVAGLGLARVLSSAPPSGGAGSLREREKALTFPPTDEEVAGNDSVLKTDAWRLEDDVIVEEIVDPRSGVALSPSELGKMPKRKFRIIPALIGAGAGAIGGGLIPALPFLLLVLGGSRGMSR